ncbi:MAG TPA: phosphatase PAP2 family protein [Gemmatimonadaceae bacterium]|nr:phosphatase PAP2 family protein [Gemmatimonadaceae bacterium]HEX2780337.1 phosphatase PAP2 family protein [Gemmatimonadaceae bacterium]
MTSLRHTLARAAAPLALLLAAARPLPAQSSDPAIRGRDLALLGGATLVTVGVMQLDSRIARAFQDSSVQNVGALRDVARGFSLINEKSLAAAGFLGYVGSRVAHARTASDVSLHVTEAIVVSSTVGTLVRGVLGRSRPFVSADDDAFDFHYGKGFRELRYRAFPSIHSSAAFSTAAVIATEMRLRNARHRRVITPLLYTIAAGPGLARMYGDKHWASDVFMGAALGTITGRRVASYSHGHPRNRIDRWLLGGDRVTLGTSGEFATISLRF